MVLGSVTDAGSTRNAALAPSAGAIAKYSHELAAGLLLNSDGGPQNHRRI